MASTWLQLPAGGSSSGGGDATAAKQDIGNAYLSSIDSKLDNQPTAANQQLEITQLELANDILADIEQALGGGAVSVEFNEVSSVPAATPTDILTYTATTDVKFMKLDAAGTNIAQYDLKINGNTINRKYTYFSSALNIEFDLKSGVQLTNGDTVVLTVVHTRPDVGNFNASIIIGD